jgi:hypothetical protein
MLSRLTKRLRIRAALALIALYSLCVLGSPLALAFAANRAGLPCFTGEHHGAAAEPAYPQVHLANGDHAHHSGGHAHREGMVHQPLGHSAPAPHGDDSPHKQRIGACCGVLCFTAMTTEFAALVREIPQRSVVVEVLQANLSGRAPGRIDRPPSTPFMTS